MAQSSSQRLLIHSTANDMQRSARIAFCIRNSQRHATCCAASDARYSESDYTVAQMSSVWLAGSEPTHQSIECLLIYNRPSDPVLDNDATVDNQM